MIRRLLIANRGEIAVRIARTAAARGIETVAVFTEADRGSLHIRRCDKAVRIADYLAIDAIIAAAERVGADAVHPGFGFLAENDSFASQVERAGLTWVGPPPAAIAAMGSKAGARALMAEAGVPVLPGYDGDDQSDETLFAKATEIGWPVIIKASAGGGGKGMQVVENEEHFRHALGEARRLAASAFGDDRMVLERYLEHARHVEVQVMADTQGTCIHLWERECSVQRRHQKVIEEAPSPAFEREGGEAKRAELCQYAVRAAQAVGYVGAGTVEFVLDGDGSAYFLEMNTRIQVEHPVTECITGVDIVALQIQVAEGQPLTLRQDEVDALGWAMEARIYAEDPDNGYLPSTGTIHCWEAPSGEGVRVDAGVETGSEVTVHYDPMLAKVIAHGSSRAEANNRLVSALRRLVVFGVTTNRDHLLRVLHHPAYGRGELHTRFLEVHADTIGPPDEDVRLQAARAAAISDWLMRPVAALPGLARNWRNNRWRGVQYSLAAGSVDAEVSVVPSEGGLIVDGCPVYAHFSADGWLHLEEEGAVRSLRVFKVGATSWVHDGEVITKVEHRPRFVIPGQEVAAGGCIASMPGKVVQVLVTEGQVVERGQPLVVMEAMKMEQTMSAATDGTVVGLNVSVGDQVAAGATLMTIEASE